MTLRRITKVFAAQNVGQLLNVLTQLLLPPIFLRVFGTSLYGQWLTLSASVSYLATLRRTDLHQYANDHPLQPRGDTSLQRSSVRGSTHNPCRFRGMGPSAHIAFCNAG